MQTGSVRGPSAAFFGCCKMKISESLEKIATGALGSSPYF